MVQVISGHKTRRTQAGFRERSAVIDTCAAGGAT